MSVRVFVVDDATYIRRLLTDLINEYDSGWSVAGEAADGQQAIDRAPEVDPDLVLLDLSMPVMDGLETLPQLRDRVPDAVVVVLTGFSEESVRQAAEQAGADAFIPKDDVVATLIPRLEAVLQAIRDGTAVRRRPEALGSH